MTHINTHTPNTLNCDSHRSAQPHILHQTTNDTDPSINSVSITADLTNWEPEACVAQRGIERFACDARLHCHIKVLRVQIQHLVHLPKTETHTTL